MNARLIIFNEISTNPENLVKIGPVHFEIYKGVCRFFLIVPKVTNSNVLISGLADQSSQNVYTMKRDLQRYQSNSSILQYSDAFKKDTMPNKGVAINFCPKIGCNGNVP